MTTMLTDPPIETEAIEYSPDDLLSMPDNDRFELVDGQLVQRNMGQVSSWVGGETHAVIREFVRQGDLGLVFPSDCGYQCFARSPKKVRKPDVSFLKKGKLPNGVMFDGWVPVDAVTRPHPSIKLPARLPRDVIIERPHLTGQLHQPFA